jgi:hypothetical protein
LNGSTTPFADIASIGRIDKPGGVGCLRRVSL